MYDYIVVGAGLSGSTIANLLATKLRKSVLVVEKNNYIGGNCNDYLHESGYLVSRHGAHIFHTNNTDVWNFIKQFSSWQLYTHKVAASINGKVVPFPISITTINKLYNINIDNEYEMKKWLQSKIVKINKPRNAKEYLLSVLGNDLYSKFYHGYSIKQWGNSFDNMDIDVVKRIPLRFDFNENYFNDQYEAIPEFGYTAVMQQMLDHSNIKVMLNTDIFSLLTTNKVPKETILIYTGNLEEIGKYLGHNFGKLPYRSVRHELLTVNADSYQDYSVINYPSETIPYTRIIEYSKIYTNIQIPNKTVIAKEYSETNGVPSYPILTPDNQVISQKYKDAIQYDKITKDTTILLGRLADYKYYNMDQAIYSAIELYKRIAQE